MSIKKPTFLIFSFFFVFPIQTYAVNDPGCCTTQGGIKACEYSTSKVVCNDGTYSTACGCSATTPTPPLISSEPTVTSTETPTPTSTPIPPQCPPLATYDETTNTCQCTSGYVVYNNSCVSDMEYCWSKYGSNATYNADTNGCTCSNGYTWNNDTTACVSFDEVCHEKIGKTSYYNADNKQCECYAGYAIQNGTCAVIPVVPLSNQTYPPVIPTTTPDSVPIETPTPDTTPTTTPKLTPIVVTPRYFPLKIIDVSKKETTAKKSNGFARVFGSIWNFIVHLFN